MVTLSGHVSCKHLDALDNNAIARLSLLSPPGRDTIVEHQYSADGTMARPHSLAHDDILLLSGT